MCSRWYKVESHPSFSPISPLKSLTSSFVYSIRTEVNKLRDHRCDVLVATPGRLKDHLANNGLDHQLKQIKFFILDEADRLLDMGFKPDIDQILQSLPDRRLVPRQSMLFSATIPPEVLKVSFNPLHTYLLISICHPCSSTPLCQVPRLF